LPRHVLVHPASGTARSGRSLAAPRQARSVAGLRVALFSNNKPNVRPFFTKLRQQLLESGAASVDLMGKLSAAFPASQETLGHLRGWDLVVNAIGD
jgi:hypothetical protein